MSTTFKGLVTSLALTTSIFSMSNPASAQVLAELGLSQSPKQCELRMVRRALALDLTIPENLSGVTDVMCGCETVSVQMLEYIRGHRDLEVLLDSTSRQCGGFSNVLANVSTASTGTSDDGRSRDRHNGDDDSAGLVDDNGKGTVGDDDGKTDGGDKGTDDGGKTHKGDKGSDDDGKTHKGDQGADDGDNGSDNGSDDGDTGYDDGDNGSDTGDNGQSGNDADGDDDGSDTGDNGSDDGDWGGHDHGDDHGHDYGDKGDKGGKGDRDHDRGYDRDHDRNC